MIRNNSPIHAHALWGSVSYWCQLVGFNSLIHVWTSHKTGQDQVSSELQIVDLSLTAEQT